MRILISGASGLIGRNLDHLLRSQGHQIIALRRNGSVPFSECITWDPARSELDSSALEGFDAVVHLAGEPIIGRWTAARRARIRDSRVRGTDLLARALAQLSHKPKVFLTASAIGIYGDTGDQTVDESTPTPDPGVDFLADVAREWEAATHPARESGIRTVQARLGVVLDRNGGALRAMLPPFRLGLGGPVGHGRQWMSWVSNRDVARAIAFLLETSTAEGPFNIVSPNPATNRDFSTALGRALHRPAILPVPPFVVKALYGTECAEATVLRSSRVLPTALVSAGFLFEDPILESALQWALKHP